MDRNSTSLFSRCRRMWSRRERPRRASECQTTSSWPRPILPEEDAGILNDDDCTPLLDASFEKADITSSRSRSSSRSSAVSRTRDQILTVPPWCRLSPTRFITVTYTLFAILLMISSASAAPLQHEHKHTLARRQAIPDRFGNTGNEPAPVASQPPPVPLATSAAPSEAAVSEIPSETFAPTISTRPSTPAPSSSLPSILSSRPQPLPSSQQPILSASLPISQSRSTLPPSSPPTTSTPTPPISPNGRPEEQLQRTTPGPPFSPGLIAGIAGGSAIALGLLIAISIILFRRRRAASAIQEIPIRRSKLGSRLGFRIFGAPSSRRPSRSPSAASKYTARSASSLADNKTLEVATGSGNRSTFGSVSGWLDKATIGRPKPAYVDTSSQFLELPRPLFAEREVERGEKDEAVWRPRRPEADAPLLGRLSGMGFGLGMGRASGVP